MKHLMSGVVQLLGSLFGMLVLAFTGYQTWMLLFEVSQNAIVATIGLILFEGGTIYWWSIFKSEAKGIMQMALSLLLFVFGLLLMVGSNGLHLGAIDPTFLGEKTPERLILVAAVISLVGKLLFPLLSPEMTQDIWRRALQGMLMVRALMKTEATIEEQSQRIANVLGADMARDVEMTLYTQYHIPHNLQRPALPAPDVVEGEVVRDVPRSQAKPPEPAKSKGNASDWWQSFLAFVGGNQPAAAPTPQAQRPKAKAGWVRIVNREDSSSRTRSEAVRPGITRIRQRPDHPPRRAKPGVSVALNELLATTNMTSEEVRSHLQKHNLTTADKAYDVLHRFGAIPKAMTFEEFRPLFTELMTLQQQQRQGNTENRPRSRKDADRTLREFAEKYKSVYGRYPENPFLDPAHFDDEFRQRRPDGVSEEQFSQWDKEYLDVLNWRHPLQQEQQEQTDGNGVEKDSPLAR